MDIPAMAAIGLGQSILRNQILTIDGNAVTFGNTIVQTSNISHIHYGRTALKPVPKALIIAVVILLLLINLESEMSRYSRGPSDLAVLLFMLLLAAVAGIVAHCIVQSRRPYGLLLYLNSGHSYIFSTLDVQALAQVVQVMKLNFEEGGQRAKVEIYDHKVIIHNEGEMSGNTFSTGNYATMNTVSPMDSTWRNER